MRTDNNRELPCRSVSLIDVVVPIAVAIIIIAVSVYLFSAYCHRPPSRSLRFSTDDLSESPHHFVSDTDLEQILHISLNLGLEVIILSACLIKDRLCKYVTIISSMHEIDPFKDRPK